jgi:beta-lactamase regulating signal transducer with metallopeptidase domain
MTGLAFDLPALAAALGAALLRASVCGGLALGIAWLLTRLPGLLTASARCWVWRLALAQLFVALFWSRSLVALPVLPAPRPQPAAVATPPPHTPLPPPGELPVPPAGGLIPGRAWGPGELLAIGWALAALAGLAALAREWKRSLRLERELDAVEDGALLARCGALARVLRLPYVPYVGSSAGIETPTLLGMTRLTVALPPALLETASSEDLEMVLAHELAHILRKDLHWTWLPVLARTLFFFHPLVWLAQREYHLAQEGACDVLAVEATGASLARYGELLLRVSTGLGEPNGRLAAAQMGEPFSQLTRRLKVMRHAANATPARRVASAAVVAGMALMGLTPWQLSARAADPAPPATARGGTGSGEGAPTPKGSFSVGPYVVRIAAVRRGGNSFSSGSSFSGGGGAFFGPGGVRRFENPPQQQQHEFRPGMTIELEVRSSDEKALSLLAGIAPGARGVDNLGRPATSGPMPAMSFPMQQRPGVRTERIELAVDPAASVLRSVDAALVMQNGEERVLLFTANEVRAGTVKRAGNVTVRIDSVEVSDQGWQVAVSYKMPQPGSNVSPLDPIGKIQQMMLGARNVSVHLRDTQGQLHRPRTAGGGSGGGGGGGSFSFGGSNGPGGSRRFSFGSDPGDAAKTSYTYTFARPSGAAAEALEFRVMERTGESRRIPFRLENVPVPDSRQGSLEG